VGGDVKRLGYEADHSPPSSAEVKECVELYLHPQYAFMAWCLVEHRDNVTFIFTLDIWFVPGGRNSFIENSRAEPSAELFVKCVVIGSELTD
jgi:hypothetical protein